MIWLPLVGAVAWNLFVIWLSVTKDEEVGYMELIDKLKDEGYDVTLRYERTTPLHVAAALHQREAVGDRLALPKTFPVRDLRAQGSEISPYGGKVTAIISLEGEEIARGESVCSPVDNFNQHEGRIKALGRAIGALREKEDS